MKEEGTFYEEMPEGTRKRNVKTVEMEIKGEEAKKLVEETSARGLRASKRRRIGV